MKIRIAVIALLLAVLSAGARPPPPPRHAPPPPPPHHRHHHHHDLPVGAFIAGTVAGTLLWAAAGQSEPVPVYVTTKPTVATVQQPRYYIQNLDGSLTPVY